MSVQLYAMVKVAHSAHSHPHNAHTPSGQVNRVAGKVTCRLENQNKAELGTPLLGCMPGGGRGGLKPSSAHMGATPGATVRSHWPGMDQVVAAPASSEEKSESGGGLRGVPAAVMTVRALGYLGKCFASL